MTTKQTLLYDVSFDVGESGIAKVAASIDSTGMPNKILNATVTIIDGARDPSSGKSPRSRKLVSGVARRARRLHQRKRKRTKQLHSLLKELGITPDPNKGTGQTYEPWLARAELFKNYVPDAKQRNHLLHQAIIHIANHRGWRNPWWGFDRLFKEPTPTQEFNSIQQGAAEYYGLKPSDLPTIGTIGARANHKGIPLRNRTAQGSLAITSPKGSVIKSKIHQADQLSELLGILEIQHIPPEDALKIARLVFKSEKPSVPKERVGIDPFSKELRAPRTSLEFQEFRIRQTIGNISRKMGTTSLRLSPEEKDIIANKLLQYSELEPPSWDEVANWIGIEASQLNLGVIDNPAGKNAPINKTVAVILNGKSKWKTIHHWWAKESSPEQRTQFAVFLGDSTESSDDSLIQSFIEDAPEDELQALIDSTKLDHGRAAYGVTTLNRLNTAMSHGHLNLSEALSHEFGVPANWKPEAPSLAEPIDHPTVDRIASDIWRWLLAITEKYGPPRRVIIEHVRNAFMSPTKKQEYQGEINRNRSRRAIMTQQLEQQGIDRIRNYDLRRYASIQMQGNTCLYCGTEIDFKTSELDHIVPRSIGGSTRRENLAAVCQDCNRSKGNKPFASWAEQTAKEGVSVKQAQERLRNWQRPQNLSVQQFKKLIRNMSIRLKRKSHDEPIDERSLESTAYAAKEIADRISSYFANFSQVSEQTGEIAQTAVEVSVFSGGVVSEARKAAGVDRKIMLRGSTKKSRLDRRHHAIDAAVAMTLKPTVARILAERIELRDSEGMLDGHEDNPQPVSWKTHNGTEFFEKAEFDHWRNRAEAITTLMQQAIEEDAIVVHRPLRLGANVGKLHEDGLEKLVQKPVKEAFSSSEVLRIVDRNLYIETQQHLNDKGGLDALGTRRPTGTILDDTNAVITLFPGSNIPTARILIRGGSAAIGDSLHHSRIYVVPGRSGKNTFYQLRVFAGEFGEIGFKNQGVDLLTAPLPEWSQSHRTALPALRRALASGEARQIGWLVAGDELEFSNPSDYIPELPVIEGLTHQSYQESRWVVTGFETNLLINLKPAYLADEGLPETAPEEAKKLLGGQGWRASINKVMQLNPTIIRRTALGKPRWQESGGLPISWSVNKKTAEIFSNGSVADS